MNKTILEKWQENVESVFRVIIHCILMNYAYTTSVRIMINYEPLIEDKVIQATVNIYDEFKMNFKFYITDLENMTEICIYEQNMSRKNSGKVMKIEEKNLITSLDYKKIKGYENSIVEFLLANIEWK